jgi:hypothetical protein
MSMKKLTNPRRRWSLIVLSLCGLIACAGSGGNSANKLYYASEMNGRVFGYQEVEISRPEGDGRATVLMRESGRAMLSALGAEFNTRFESEYQFDPETWQLRSGEQNIDQESIKIKISASVEGSSARIAILPGGGEKTVDLPPDVVFENPVYFPHLRKDFIENNIESKRYRTLDLLDREVQEATYSKRALETIELGKKTYRAFVLDYLNHEIGLKLRLWIDMDSGYLLKAERPRGTSALAERSVKNRLQRAALDNHILARAGAMISDIRAISYMKVRASLEPVGNWITPESLNVRGQVFEGTVDDNRVEGLFEVRHEKYDGRHAPAFPPVLGNNPEVKTYLEAEDFIESDDPVLIRKAKELTAGAADSWEAAKRLSLWVAEEIGYDIPGGTSARNTYDIREGECGAHSRLFAAFCRAVGIPTRVIWGCMYTPNAGGTFGQHAWNEVYMGEAGWIPVDTTAREIDFADSGHIRLGILSSAHIAWNPKKLEILDFHAGSQRFGQVAELGDSEKNQAFLGKYQGPRAVFTVLVQNGSLGIDIPGRMIFELQDPDDQGLWFFKLTRDVNVSFQRNDSGRVNGLTLVNRARIPKKAAAEDNKEDVPEKWRTYLGQYPIPMEKTELSVLSRKGSLAIRIPGQGTFNLEGPDSEGMWTKSQGGDRFSFVFDDDGQVRALVIHEIFSCPRIEP